MIRSGGRSKRRITGRGDPLLTGQVIGVEFFCNTAASPEQRNALARLVFESIEIEDDRVTAVVPQPEFAPFFVRRAQNEGLLEDNSNSATEVTPSSEVMNGRKRRGSVPRLLSFQSDDLASRSPICAPR